MSMLLEFFYLNKILLTLMRFRIHLDVDENAQCSSQHFEEFPGRANSNDKSIFPGGSL